MFRSKVYAIVSKAWRSKWDAKSKSKELTFVGYTSTRTIVKFKFKLIKFSTITTSNLIIFQNLLYQGLRKMRASRDKPDNMIVIDIDDKNESDLYEATEVFSYLRAVIQTDNVQFESIHTTRSRGQS